MIKYKVINFKERRRDMKLIKHFPREPTTYENTNNLK